MRHLLTGIGIALFLTTGAVAQNGTTQPIKAESAAEDCSKQVWPHFTPACLRNSDKAIAVRLVTSSSR